MNNGESTKLKTRIAFSPEQLKLSFEKFQREHAKQKIEKSSQSLSMRQNRQKRLEPISSFSVQSTGPEDENKNTVAREDGKTSTTNLQNQQDRQDFLPKDLMRNFYHKYAPVKNTEMQLTLPKMQTNAHHDYSIT